MIGQTISHYKILEKLGEGGMGVVYKAQDIKLNRFVALKFLPAHLSASEQDKARFIQEAQAAASLNHPNICTIYGIDEHEGQIFIAMELIDGRTLRETTQSFTVKQTVDIGVQIADGLAAAHEKGIVHRDIKPENIMIRKDGIVQIMDFGLAKLRGASRLTKEGTMVGTVGYMSPEQVQGQDTDHRTDIFSLGVILYELLSGQSPFKGVHETAIIYEIVNVDAAPISSIKPEIESEIDAIVLECLAKDPDERYQSAKEVAKELRRFKRESSRTKMSQVSTARPVQKKLVDGETQTGGTPTWKKFLWPAVAAIFAVASLVLLWSPWRSEGTSKQVLMRFPINLPLAAPLIGGASTVAVSPDGKYIVYLALESGNSKLFLRPLDQLIAQPMAGTEGANDPFFSPDGQWVAFFVNGKLRKVSIFGGAPQDICDVPGTLRGGWWDSDNTIWYGHINSPIHRVPSSGGTPVEVTRLDTAHGELSHRFPQILPDGKTVIFTIKNTTMAEFDEAEIAAENTVTHERKVLIRGGSFARYLPTGHIMYARGKSLYAVPFDANKVEIKGTPLPVVEGGMLNRLSGNANFEVSNTGTLVYVPLGPVSDDDATVAGFDRQGNVHSILDTLRAYAEGSYSPDGGKLAVTIRAANDDIWVYQIARRTLTRLTFGGGNSASPAWSPDGMRVVYVSERGKSLNLFWKPWDGSGKEEVLGDARGVEGTSGASFTPDGKTIAYAKDGDIWTMPLEGDRHSRPFIQTPTFESEPQFSPDGRFLAYVSNESGRAEVYVIPFPQRDGKWQVSTNGGASPHWVRNGKELIYVEGRNVMSVDVKLNPTFDYSAPRRLFQLPSLAFSFVMDVSPDGKTVAVDLAKAREAGATQVNVVVGWFEELRQRFSLGTK